MALTQLDTVELQQSLGCGSDWASIVAGYLLEYPDSVSKLAFCKLFQVYADKVHFTFTSGPDPASLPCPTAPIDTPEKLAKLRKNKVGVC